jgi:hypothetical protein
MKKTVLLLLIIVLNLNANFSQTELTNDILPTGKSVEIRIKSNKKVYQIGDVIQIKIIFDSKTNDDLLIAFREGSFHFKQLKILQNNKQLSSAGICKEKIAPLGFLESDYHALNSKDSLEFELNLEIINFPIKRNCFEEEFYKSGYGILSNRYGVIFKNIGDLDIVLEYQISFPSSNKESIHSAYHKKKNVWNQALISNTINIKIEQ